MTKSFELPVAGLQAYLLAWSIAFEFVELGRVSVLAEPKVHAMRPEAYQLFLCLRNGLGQEASAPRHTFGAREAVPLRDFVAACLLCNVPFEVRAEAEEDFLCKLDEFGLSVAGEAPQVAVLVKELERRFAHWTDR